MILMGRNDNTRQTRPSNKKRKSGSSSSVQTMSQRSLPEVYPIRPIGALEGRWRNGLRKLGQDVADAASVTNESDLDTTVSAILGPAYLTEAWWTGTISTTGS